MNIQGERITLRAISIDDAELLKKLINDADTEHLIAGASFPVSTEEQKNWIMSQIGKKDVLRCVIALKGQEDKGIGTVMLTDIDYKNGVAQVHIKMDKDEGRGKGYGTEAMKTIVEYAFDEMRLNCIYSEVLIYNTVSQKMFQKVGFKKDGVLRSRVFKGGEYIDVISYSLLKSDRENG